MRTRTYLASSILALSIAGVDALAQNFEFAADYLRYDDRRQWVSVEGNIEVKTEYGYFYPDYVEYDVANERLYVDGEVRGALPTGERIIARYSELDFKAQSVILGQVRALLNSGMQVDAGYFDEEEDTRYGEFIVASTCTVCYGNPVPIWQLRAEQVLQDKVAQKVYVHNGFFDLFGIPIGWVPYVRFPAPEVKRMEGFLAPSFTATTGDSRGLLLRYYIPISDYTDVTSSVQLSSLETQILGLDFRHNGQGYDYQAIGRYIRSSNADDNGRYYLLQKASMRFPFGINAQARFAIDSDYNVNNDFDFQEPKSNYFFAQKFTDFYWVHGEFLDYLPPTEKKAENDDYDYPAALPHIYGEYSKILYPGIQLNTDFDLLNLRQDRSEDIARISSAIDVKATQILPLGILATTQLGVQGGLYDVSASAVSADNGTAARLTPFGAVDLQWPFLRSTAKADHLLTPRIMMSWSENYDEGVPIPNTDSLFVEHDFVSLFTLNHFTGRDAFEGGFRSSVGLTYNMMTPENRNLELGLGRIWSSEQLDDIDTPANPILEDWVGYLNYQIDDQWNLYSRFAFDNSFNFSRSEIEFAYDGRWSDYSIEWVRLGPEPQIGFDDVRSEVLLKGDYQFAPNWQFDYDVRYDLANRQAFDAEIGLTYGNECIEVTTGIDWKFARTASQTTERNLTFNVELFGLSEKRKDKWAKRTCSFTTY